MDKHSELGELLESIKYINRKSQSEIELTHIQMLNLIKSASLPEVTSRVLLDEISFRLGRLAARIDLIEESVESIDSQYKVSLKRGGASRAKYASNRFTHFSVPISHLTENANLLPLEVSDNNISYCWTGEDPEVEFNFPLNRTEKLSLQIRFFSLIKPEYSRQLKILIDGKHIKHWLVVEDKLFVLSCNLPATTNVKSTAIKIVLPSTHSPMELGHSGDERQLGIAISEIRFGIPERRIDHLLRRLKLKK